MPGLARSVQERELLINTMDELCIIIHITSPIEMSDGKQSKITNVNTKFYLYVIVYRYLLLLV